MAKVKFSKIIENYNLKNYIPEIDNNSGSKQTGFAVSRIL